MCGIAGLVRIDAAPVDVAALRQMTARLRHRGPDDEGYLLGAFPAGAAVAAGGADTVEPLRHSLPPIASLPAEPGHALGFGHRRLSIVDCTPNGHQPMADASGMLWLAYNGEVYNHIELRTELEAKGHRFRTRSDTEVILAAYREWGRECLQRFNGMWAFALWDRARGELFCARDRFGVKPFYYHAAGPVFAFASEIKALLPAMDTAAVNEATAYDYLASGLVEHTPDTMIAGIRQLPAGHWLVLDGRGQLDVRRYYAVPHAAQPLAGDDAQIARLAAEYRVLLSDAVRLRLRTDVPLGSCLSGGLDSSSIVCLMHELLSASDTAPAQRTFTAAYDDSACDERRYATQIVDTVRANAVYTFPRGEELWDELQALAWHQDEPFVSTSIYAQWCVMRAARRHGVTVLLDGQGADELFAGYTAYVPIFLKHLLRHGALSTYRRELTAGAALLGQRRWRLAAKTLAVLYEPVRRVVPQAVRGVALLDTDFARRSGGRHRAWRDRRSTADLQARLLADFTQFNLPQLLRYEDRNSMAFSIEARLPFLDYRLVEWACAQPVGVKIHDGWTKYVARRGVAGLCPDAIVWRKDKIGFATPEARWMQAGEEMFRALSDPATFRARRFLDPAKLRAQLLPGGRLTPRWRPELWRALNFELWMRVFALH